ncbi:hypothetical protein DJ018_07565 [Phenylobacterium deserti]|uniref:Uncharacterized protein n=1 Tax=Phenylobacterium deserti TaxID=1914756 RepID=A0A328AT91_9CAUL|nr:hypothetical protein DJ018_07565 [Phenylobacterium deserti]
MTLTTILQGLLLALLLCLAAGWQVLEKLIWDEAQRLRERNSDLRRDPRFDLPAVTLDTDPLRELKNGPQHDLPKGLQRKIRQQTQLVAAILITFGVLVFVRFFWPWET